MKAVSNSSTLILLAKVTCLKLFLETCEKVIIPEQVYKESVENKRSFDALLIQKEVGNKIEIKKTNRDITFAQEQFHLDEGEAAAYALYDPEVHNALLTDDRELIKLCKLEGIKFVCAIAIVVQLYKNNKLSKEEALEKIGRLREVGRYKEEIINYFKSEVK